MGNISWFGKMSNSDSTTDRPAAMVEKETVKEALAEILVKMLGFKALMGEASTAAGASRSHESSRGSEAG